MTLGQVFKDNSIITIPDGRTFFESKGYFNLNNNLQQSDYKELARQLNNIFYNQKIGNSGQTLQKIQDEYIKKREQELGELMGQLANSETFKVSGVEKKINKSIEVGSIRRIYQKCIDIRGQLENSLKKNGINEAAIKTKLNELNNAIKALDTYIIALQKYSAFTSVTTNSKIFTSSDKDLTYNTMYEKINILRAYEKLFSVVNINSDLGRFFENAIKTLDLNQVKQNFIDSNIDDILSSFLKKTEGDIVGRRGGYNSMLSISFNVNNLADKKDAVLGSKKFTQNEGNGEQYTFSYDAGSKRQLKMDAAISINIPNSNGNLIPKTFRISAKNWASKFGDLGNTNILAAILRSTDKSVLSNFAFANLMGSSGVYYKAHELAKYAILFDIIIGASQNGLFGTGNGYANALVINNRSDGMISVINPYQIIKETLKTDSTASSILGYPSNMNNDAWSNLNKVNFNSPGRSSAYLALFYNYLSQQKVSVSLNASKFDF